MPRQIFASLSCLAIGMLSCGHFSLPLSGELPPVSLAAPLHGVEGDAADPMIDRAIRYLEGRRSGLSEAEIADVATTIVREARIHGLDPNLVLAVIHIESRGNTFALSPVGAMGIMQIMPPTGEELAAKLDIPWRGAQTLFDPQANVRMGVAYLKQLESRYGDMKTALAAYNWGPGRIDSKIRRGVAVPASYSGSVLATYRAP
ncbi:MAG: lytic transglycosylase domain-containing protein [Deltaproteobacteria bacterium]|nr:lytic transglycosylase domain-containing protein [Deltaproteobacteria bacterium]